MKRIHIITFLILGCLIGSTIYKTARHHQKAEAGRPVMELMRKGNEVSKPDEGVVVSNSGLDSDWWEYENHAARFYLWRVFRDQGYDSSPEYIVVLTSDSVPVHQNDRVIFSNDAGYLLRFEVDQE